MTRLGATPLPPARDWDHAALNLYAGGWRLFFNAQLADVVAHCRGGLAYLATPYTGAVQRSDGCFDVARSLACSVRAARWLRLLALEGVSAVSPVVQSVEMLSADYTEGALDPLDGAFWAQWCRPMLRAADTVIVPQIAGWRESDGIWAEVREALLSGKRVFVMHIGAEYGPPFGVGA